MKKLIFGSILLLGTFPVMAMCNEMEDSFNTQSIDNIECITLDNDAKEHNEVCQKAILEWKLIYANSNNIPEIKKIVELKQNDSGKTLFSFNVEITTDDDKTHRVHIPGPPGIP